MESSNLPTPEIIQTPREPTTKITTTTTTTTTTTASTTTAKADEGSSTCVLASTLSATFVILFLVISGLVYFFYKKKKKLFHSKSGTQSLHETNTLPRNQTSTFPRNPRFQPDDDYKVPPHREEPLPRKQGMKKEPPINSPYHGPVINQEEYSVPPIRNEPPIMPPPPPNVARRMQKQNENKELRSGAQNTASNYYLDMEGVKDDLYQNVGDSPDCIYINP